MPLYEIINPSDAYGIEGEDPLVCAVAVLMLGRGSYSLQTMDDKREDVLPLFLFGGSDEWLKEQGIDDLGAYLNDNRIALADALDTVMISPKAYAIAKDCLPEGADLAEFKAQWRDKHRSSMNDIGAGAWALAARLREVEAEASAATSTK